MLPLTSIEHSHLDRAVHFRAKVDDVARLPGLDDLKILLRQVGDEPAFAVAHDRRHRDDLNRRAKSRRRLLFLRLCLRLHSWRSQGEHRSDDAREHRLPPRHAGIYTKALPYY